MHEAGVDLGGGGDPFVVGLGQGGWVVEPGPHDGAGGEGKEEAVGLGGEQVGEGAVGLRGGAEVAAPEVDDEGLEGAGGGEEG